jgi:uncharacterized protein (UPF0333 family)
MILDFLNIEKNSSKEFWFSHSIILLATIFGVYLAAISGFEQAIKFENTISYKNNYYLQKSMRDELTDNIAYIDEIGNKYLQNYIYVGKKDEVGLDNFIWEAMKFAPETFEVQSHILTNVRRYYTQATTMLQRITSKRANALDKKLVRKVLQLGEKLQENIVPTINSNLEQLKALSIQQGITI